MTSSTASGSNHLPSGRFAANGAWLAVQVIAHNLARWTARLGLGAGIVTTRTLRRRYFALAGRLTHSARRWTLHLRSAGPGPGSWQPRSCDYGRYRSRPDARSRRRPGSEPRASMPAHASRTRAPAPSAPPSRACSLRHRPANAGTPAKLSGSPASRSVKLRSVDPGLRVPRETAPACLQCCGEGEASPGCRRGLSRPHAASVETFGVELHAERAEEAKHRLDRVLGASASPDAFFGGSHRSG